MTITKNYINHNIGKITFEDFFFDHHILHL